jgi:hypothetical protein
MKGTEPLQDGTVLTYSLHSLCTIPLTPATKRVARSQPSRIWIQRNHITKRGEVAKRLKNKVGLRESVSGTNPRWTRKRFTLDDIHVQAFRNPLGIRHQIAVSPRKSTCQARCSLSGGHAHVPRCPSFGAAAFSGGGACGSGSGCHLSAWPSLTSGREFSTE